jgi:hypothetical protein
MYVLRVLEVDARLTALWLWGGLKEKRESKSKEILLGVDAMTRLRSGRLFAFLRVCEFVVECASLT